MVDRELIEFAAKACGMWDHKNGCIDKPWSPLTDDGDALRLAVKLNLLVDVSSRYGHTEAGPAAGYQCEMHCGDPYAATRRAIVRAAAEVGKAMP